MPIPPDLSILDKPFALSEAQISFYRENQFIKLLQVLPPEVLIHYAAIISDKVQELNTQHLPLEARSTYDKAFLQIMNLWTHSEAIRQLVFSQRLAQIATELMGVEGVRLYHDQALFKEPGGGFTPWHADQYYWPLASDYAVTAWIPLQEVPLEMGPLEFSAKSYLLHGGRELKISDESEQIIAQKLRINDFKHVVKPYELGELSFHSGWVFHRAGPNSSPHMRQVMTVIYMDKNMRLKAPENPNQQNDWDTWCPGAVVGELMDTPINPVLYPTR